MMKTSSALLQGNKKIEYSETSSTTGNSVVFWHEGSLHTLHSSAPNYNRVIEALEVGDRQLLGSEMVLAKTINSDLSKITERMKIVGSSVIFDGVNLSSVLSAKIIQAKKMGLDYEPLVNFAERLITNPSAYSREQLFGFLERHDFKIKQDGNFIGYKGTRNGKSTHRGTATVNGEEITGYIPYSPGDEVTMPRNKVNQDPRNGCSTGLHVGTYDYAKSYGKLFAAEINPVDVVSVPLDSNYQKIRTSRLVVMGDNPDDIYNTPGLYWTR